MDFLHAPKGNELIDMDIAETYRETRANYKALIKDTIISLIDTLSRVSEEG